MSTNLESYCALASQVTCYAINQTSDRQSHFYPANTMLEEK
ncbi:hypothetical protein [Nostoc sp. DedQUE04]